MIPLAWEIESPVDLSLWEKWAIWLKKHPKSVIALCVTGAAFGTADSLAYFVEGRWILGIVFSLMTLFCLLAFIGAVEDYRQNKAKVEP